MQTMQDRFPWLFAHVAWAVFAGCASAWAGAEPPTGMVQPIRNAIQPAPVLAPITHPAPVLQINTNIGTPERRQPGYHSIARPPEPLRVEPTPLSSPMTKDPNAPR